MRWPQAQALAFLLIAGCGGPGGAPPNEADEAPGREPRAAAFGHEPIPTELQRQLTEAKALSESIAGEDPQRFRKVFRQAVQLAPAFREPEIATREDDRHPLEAFLGEDGFLDRLAALAGNPGRMRTFVYRGQTDQADRFPDCVAVGGSSGWFCTGTLVAPRVVVSAAHCVPFGITRIFAGQDVNGEGREVRVTRALKHKNFDPDSRFRDLSVLILDRPLTAVRPRAFASSEVIDDALDLTVAGYGYSDLASTTGLGRRRYASVIVTSNSCTPHDATRFRCDQGNEIVTGPGLDRGVCGGDSGGPVYVSANGQWLLAAATSRPTKISQYPCGDGAIYTRVDRLREWVARTAGDAWPTG